jgi:hypothetical protein
MSEFRHQDFDYLSPEDPFRNDAKMDADARGANAVWGWIAAAMFLVVLAVSFGIGHQPGGIGANLGTNTASNDATPPAATRMAPPTMSVLPPTTNPTPATPAAPITPAPATPLPTTGSQ